VDTTVSVAFRNAGQILVGLLKFNKTIHRIQQHLVRRTQSSRDEERTHQHKCKQSKMQTTHQQKCKQSKSIVTCCREEHQLEVRLRACMPVFTVRVQAWVSAFTSASVCKCWHQLMIGIATLELIPLTYVCQLLIIQRMTLVHILLCIFLGNMISVMGWLRLAGSLKL